MKTYMTLAALAVLFVAGLWVGRLTHPAYDCPEDAVYTWNGGRFPAPRADYGCHPLDDLEGDG